MLKQIVVHKVVVALVIVPGKSLVLVQIYGFYLGEIQIAFVAPLDQLFVGTDGRRAGCQSQHAVRFHDHLCRNDIGCLSAHGVIVFYLVHPHNKYLRKNFFYAFTI